MVALTVRISWEIIVNIWEYLEIIWNSWEYMQMVGLVEIIGE